MRKSVHVFFGVLAGFLALALFGKFPKSIEEALTFRAIVDIFIALIGGYIGGVFPDWFEPGTNRRHRGFFHSRIMLIILIVLVIFIQLAGLGSHYLDLLATVFCFGYISHLLLDSLTPAGLPKA